MKRLFFLFFAFSLFLCSCAETELYQDEGFAPVDTSFSTESQENAKNDVFSVAFCSSESADPYTSSNKINFELMGLITEPLFSVSDTFEVTPVLCSDYKCHGKVHTFTIKEGVSFSDGSPVKASDVKASILGAAEPSSYYATRLSVVESVVSDNRRRTVTVTLKYENELFPALLDFPIIKEGTRKNLLPVGTGIYAPDKEATVLTARENHHSGNTPLYETINLCNTNASDELLFNFNNLNVSVFTTDPTGTSPQLPSLSVDTINIITTNMHYIGFNTRNPQLASKSIRQAIARAIDRKSIAESDFALMGEASCLPLHPYVSYYPSEQETGLEFESELKIESDEPLTILVNSENGAKLSACNRIAEALTAKGIPTTVRALPFEEYTASLQNGDFTLYYAEVSLGADFDITRIIEGSLNFGGFSDPSLKSALSAYLAAPEESINAYVDAFCDTVPFAPIFFKKTAMYTQKNFFTATYPTSQNIYHRFCDWKIKGGN